MSVLAILCCVFMVGYVELVSDYGKKSCNAKYYSWPRCINHPDGYGCECGPGFRWNKEMCISTAIDSRFEFSARKPIRYTLLLGKAFPRLENCTVAFWIRTKDNRKDSTVMSYRKKEAASYRRKENVFRLYQNKGLYFRLWKKRVHTKITLETNVWSHIVWTLTSKSGAWTFYKDGLKVSNGTIDTVKTAIPGGGEFVMGQASRQVSFNSSYAFVGDISHLNIWNYVENDRGIRHIYESCTYMYCGNVVQWADFRSGTRGAMRMRWPSGIYDKECFSAEEGASTCNKHCSDVIGAQCNEEIVENIRWARTPAINTIAVPCPGNDDKWTMEQNYGNATRSCNRTEQNEGIWNPPNIDDCITEELRDLKFKILDGLSGPYIEEILILELADQLLNHTTQNIYTNAIDIATVIDLLEVIVDTQAEAIVLNEEILKDGDKQFKRIGIIYPTVDQTNTFSQIIISIVDNLLHGKNDKGWIATKPAGVEGDHLLSVMKCFADIIAKSLQYHFQDRLVKKYDEADVIISKENIEFKVTMQAVSQYQGFKFPDSKDIIDGVSRKHGSIELLENVVMAENISTVPDLVFLETSSFRYRHLGRYIPNHEYKSKSKEDNVNSPVIALYIHANGGMPILNNLSTPIIIRLPLVNTFNISNPECVRVRHETQNGTQKRRWKWIANDCEVISYNGKSVVCHCRVPGVFSATTDMYNVNWDKGYIRPILMNAASYFGCVASAAMCLATLVVHLYYKTSSCTASLHKNLSVSITLSQLFMCGVDLYDYKIVCHTTSVLLHYFFLATYSWLMNEAFNLYIVITYSAHSHSEPNESGGQVRYYFLGWVVPGILVGAFVGSQGDGYYAKDMCWIDWQNLWLFCGPALGIMAVSTMVMIFTAKEQNENSYTKSEKTNKIITIHMRGLWSQIILVTVVWSFAFVSLKMHDTILKYLYALINCLQGAFFIVFYLFLHEEINAILKSSKITKALLIQGMETDDRSMGSGTSFNLIEKEPLDKMKLTKRSPPKSDRLRKRKPKIEVSTDEEMEGSDCEMITTV